MLFKFLICFLAGIGAGLGTGFAGMSAAAVISPMLITFWDFRLMRRWGSRWPAMFWPVLSAPIHMEKTRTWISETAWL